MKLGKSLPATEDRFISDSNNIVNSINNLNINNPPPPTTRAATTATAAAITPRSNPASYHHIQAPYQQDYSQEPAKQPPRQQQQQQQKLAGGAVKPPPLQLPQQQHYQPQQQQQPTAAQSEATRKNQLLELDRRLRMAAEAPVKEQYTYVESVNNNDKREYPFTYILPQQICLGRLPRMEIGLSGLTKPI